MSDDQSKILAELDDMVLRRIAALGADQLELLAHTLRKAEAGDTEPTALACKLADRGLKPGEILERLRSMESTQQSGTESVH